MEIGRFIVLIVWFYIDAGEIRTQGFHGILRYIQEEGILGRRPEPEDHR
jgi:hypothetical protein